jgi:hypothetical protein
MELCSIKCVLVVLVSQKGCSSWQINVNAEIQIFRRGCEAFLMLEAFFFSKQHFTIYYSVSTFILQHNKEPYHHEHGPLLLKKST